MKEFIEIPKLETVISDEERKLELAVINEDAINYELAIQVFCSGFGSRQAGKVIEALFYTVDKYRDKRANASLAKKSNFLRDEEKPLEIHPVRSAEFVKAAGGAPFDITATLLHDLPEDLADDPKEMQTLLHEIENKFSHIDYVNVYALQNKHQTLVKFLQKNNITNPDKIRKKLNKVRSGSETKRVFRYQVKTLLDTLKIEKNDPLDILYKLRKKTYSQYLRNSQNYLNAVYEQYKEAGNEFSLLSAPIAKTGERIDNTRTVYFRKKGKKTDVFLRNCEVLDQNMRLIEKGITNKCFEHLNKKLIYNTLKKIHNEIRFLEFDLDLDTKPVHTEFTEMYNLIENKYKKFLLGKQLK